jgi:hypothetical protein
MLTPKHGTRPFSMIPDSSPIYCNFVLKILLAFGFGLTICALL